MRLGHHRAGRPRRCRVLTGRDIWRHRLPDQRIAAVEGGGGDASGFGVNNASDMRICNTVSKNNRLGVAFAFWQSSGIRRVDCTALDNGGAGFDFERMIGKSTFVQPVACGSA